MHLFHGPLSQAFFGIHTHTELPLSDSDMEKLLTKAMKSKDSVQVPLPLTQPVSLKLGNGAVQVERVGTDRYRVGYDFAGSYVLETLCQKLGFPKQDVQPTDTRIFALFRQFGPRTGSLFGYPKRTYAVTPTVAVLVYQDKFICCSKVG